MQECLRKDRYYHLPLIAHSTNASTTALTPAVLKALLPQQAYNTTLGVTTYGITVASAQAALSGLVLNDSANNGISLDGLLALIVANIQNIYTNLKAANVAGFTTY